MRRGFLTGLTAVLVLTVFLSFFAIQQAKTNEEVADLIEREALRVHQRFADGSGFSNETLKDGLLDAAVAAHGCQPSGTLCTQLSTRVKPYLDGTSRLLSQDGLLANFSVSLLSCGQVPSAPGFDIAYVAGTNLSGVVRGAGVSKRESFLNDWTVLVNTSARRIEVRAGSVQRFVRLSCQGVNP